MTGSHHRLARRRTHCGQPRYRVLGIARRLAVRLLAASVIYFHETPPHRVDAPLHTGPLDTGRLKRRKRQHCDAHHSRPAYRHVATRNTLPGDTAFTHSLPADTTSSALTDRTMSSLVQAFRTYVNRRPCRYSQLALHLDSVSEFDGRGTADAAEPGRPLPRGAVPTAEVAQQVISRTRSNGRTPKPRCAEGVPRQANIARQSLDHANTDIGSDIVGFG